MGPLCIFWSVWKARNTIVFRNDVLSLQKIKLYFVYLLWSETKLYIVDGPSLDHLINLSDSRCKGVSISSWISRLSYLSKKKKKG